MPRDELAEALWEGAPPASWDKALGVLASKLRKVLADGAEAIDLTASSGCYRLVLPADAWVDVIAADEAAEYGERLLAGNDADGAIAAATLAESLLAQPFVPGDDGTWVHGKRREFEQARVRALNVLAESCLRCGHGDAAVRWAEQAVELEQFREGGYRRLMAAHMAAGNGAEALRVYERCRRLLAEELGAFPSPETETLYRRLLDEPVGAAGHAPPPVEEAPLRGRTAEASHRRLRIAVAAVAVVGGIAAVTFVVVGGGDASLVVVPNSVVRIDPRTLKVTQVVQVSETPDLVVASGGYLWITNHILRDSGNGLPLDSGARTLTRVDASTGKEVVVGGGLAPCGLTADPSGDVWVANCYPAIRGPHDNVVRVGAKTLAFKKTWPVPGGAGFLRGVAYGGGSLWVSQIVGGESKNRAVVTRIDPQSGAERTLHLRSDAWGIAWSGGYGDLWLDDFESGSLTRLHPSTGAETTIGDVFNPAFAAVDGDAVWIGNWFEPQVVRVNATGRPGPKVVDLPGGTGVWNVASGAGAVWATTPHAGALWRIDPATNRVTRVDLAHLPTGVTTDANDVWVTVRGA